MVKVYYINTSQIKDYKYYYKYLSKQRLDKISKINNQAKIKESVFAELLVRYGLFKEGVNVDEIDLEYDERGKPTYHHFYHVSISHSKDVVAVAISDNIVGIDCEYMAKEHITLAPKVLSELEYLRFSQANDQVLRFYRYWSAKESYLKMLGIGIVADISKIEVEKNIAKGAGPHAVVSVERYNDYLISCATPVRENIIRAELSIGHLNRIIERGHGLSILKKK